MKRIDFLSSVAQLDFFGFANMEPYQSAPSAVITGTAGDDTLNGTAGNDAIDGLGGNDTIDGGDGNDRIHGGEGNDTMRGGYGDDIFVFTNNDGNTGDFIFGGAGTDTLRIEQTSGVLERHNFFNTSFDSIEAIEFATANTSSVPSEIFFRAAQFGNGQISENAAFEGTGVYNRQNIAIYMDGAAAFDMSGFTFTNFHSGLTVNTIGGAAAETVTGSATQFVTFDAGAGDDVFDVRGGGMLIGGDGIDTVTYANFVSASNTGVTARLSTDPLIANRHEAEIVIGSQYDDVLTSYIANTALSGGDGNDLIWANASGVTMNGEAGDDSFYLLNAGVYDGGTGTDTIVLLGGAYYSTKDATASTLGSIERFEFAYSYSSFGSGSRGVTIELNADQFSAGGISFSALFDGDNNGAGRDVIDVTMANALSVDLSNLQFADWVSGTDLVIITGDDDAETIIGSNVDDTIDGRGGDDRIQGSAGNDTINGWTGVDTAVYVGEHTRYVMSSDANDVITITGTDTGTGTDTLTFMDIVEIGGVAFTTSGSAPSFTAGADHHIGGNAGETFDALAGDDVLYGLGGDDMFIGGAGADYMNGGAGTDTVSYANSAVGVDVTAGRFGYFGTAEGDTLTGIENLIGSDYNDVLYGDAGANTLSGGAGRDVLRGNDGDDTLIGGDEVGAGDLLEGHAGNDILRGGGGDDTLIGGIGADQLFGGAGSDILYTEGSDTAVSGGAGYDYLIVANSLAGGTWTASDIEEWYGNASNETFDATGSTERVIMITNEGNDTLIGGLGGDVLLGGSGNDIVSGGLGNDDLFGNAGADEIYGGAGSDIIRFDAHDTVVSGGADYDYALAEGTDAVFLSLTNGAIEFAVGTNTHDQLSGENASWHVTIYGGAGNDTIYAGNAGSYLRGEAGQDSLVGGAGADYFEGGADADVIWMLNNGGIDFMYDFQDGTDFVNLSLITGVSGFGDITVDSSTATNGWFSVDYGSGTLWLQAGAGATIDANDFIFAAPPGQDEALEAQSTMPALLAAGDVNAPLKEGVGLDQFIFDDAPVSAAADDAAFGTFSDAVFGEAQAVDAMAAWCADNNLAEIGDPELPDMFIHPEDIGYFDWG